MRRPNRTHGRGLGNRALFFGIAAIIYAPLIFVLSSQPSIPEFMEPVFSVSDKLAHFIEFAILGGFLFLTFASAGWRPFDAPMALVLGVAYGLTDELHQLLVPGRMGDPMDALANGAGAIIAVLILALADRKYHPSQMTSG